LSLCSNTMEDSYADYQKLTDALTGEKSKRDAIEKKILEMNSDGDAKGKKGKKAAGKKKKR